MCCILGTVYLRSTGIHVVVHIVVLCNSTNQDHYLSFLQTPLSCHPKTFPSLAPSWSLITTVRHNIQPHFNIFTQPRPLFPSNISVMCPPNTFPGGYHHSPLLPFSLYSSSLPHSSHINFCDQCCLNVLTLREMILARMWWFQKGSLPPPLPPSSCPSALAT